MSTTHEQLLRSFIAAFEAGDVETITRLVAPDIVDHTLPPGGAPGIDGLLYAVGAYRQGFPDVRITVDLVVSDRDLVVGYGRIRGTHDGEFFGIPPSGNSVDVAYIDVYRVVAGRITETWHLEDIAALMRQVGAGQVSG